MPPGKTSSEEKRGWTDSQSTGTRGVGQAGGRGGVLVCIVQRRQPWGSSSMVFGPSIFPSLQYRLLQKAPGATPQGIRVVSQLKVSDRWRVVPAAGVGKTLRDAL